MARPIKDGLPKWRPQRATIRKAHSDNCKVRYKALRNSSGIYIKRAIERYERVAWRIVKDWVEAQMAILESEMVQLDEIFLPYMVARSGQTLFEAYRNNQLMLPGEAET